MPLLLGPDRYLGEMLDHRVVASLTLTRTLYRVPARLPLHTHAAPYFCLVLEGAFDESVGARSYQARSGMLVFHPPGETHSNEIRVTGTRVFNIAFGGSFAGFEPRRRPRPGPQGAAAARIAHRVARELPARDPISSLAIEGLMLTLLAEAASSAESSRGGPPRWLPVAVDYIRAHYRDRLDHDALSRVAGVHPTHLARAFHRHMRCTVTGYVHRLRIEWAREQLARGDDPLADVALDAGFADQAHLARVFRRATGVTPSEYRRRSRRSRGRGRAGPAAR
jgi:AraC family transcriptional regulator